MRFLFSRLVKGYSIIFWIQRRLTPKQFLIFSAILIGLTAGLAAVLVKSFVHFFLHTISVWSAKRQVLAALGPLIGISLTVIYVKYFNNNKLGKGLSNILNAIARKSSILPRDQTYSHIISSSLTIGFGGSSGIESPMVTTGSAIGSNYGKAYKLSYKERTLLLACGAAAGIAGAFNTPIAGVLFALEVLLVEANISAFIPILIAAAAGALVSQIILAEGVLLHFQLREPFNYHNVPFYLLLGVFCGLASYYYSRVFLSVENRFKRFEASTVTKVLLSGSLLFVLILLFPPLFGEGYVNIAQLSALNATSIFDNSIIPLEKFSQPLLYGLLIAVILLKPIATAATISGGGNGGNFAPSLFMGAFVGYLFSSVLSDLHIVSLPVSNFTLVAMAGVLSGVFHAPLTGIFIIAEITGGYELIIPLMMVSAMSYAVSKYFMPLSIDFTKLSEKEKILRTNTDEYLLSNLSLRDLVETDFLEVYQTDTLRKLVEKIAVSRRNIFPVLDNEGRLTGLITVDDIRDIMFKQDLYDKLLTQQLMHLPQCVITEKDDIRSAMKLFDESHLWNIPVVMENKYLGFISKSSILEQYREVLIQTSLE